MWDTAILIEENDTTNIMKENINMLRELLKSEIIFVNDLKKFGKYLMYQGNNKQTFFGIARLNIK